MGGSPDLALPCSAAKLRVLHCLVWLSDGDVTSSFKYLDHVSINVSVQKRTAMAEQLKSWWVSLPPPARQIWLDDLTSTGAGKFALRVARKFALETSLHDWVEDQNLGKGVAPCTKVVLDVCTTKRIAGRRCGYTLPAGRRSRWQWMHRFRQTWGVGLGRFQEREQIGQAEMLQKARMVFLSLLLGVRNL